ncbi:MAG: YdbL family protein [Gammaproteobacteria bacterium]|nr:YdbL family protein [Gammaproteobacteria bacterium]
MKNTISKTLLLACLLVLAPLSFALTLQEAKNEGLVGELRNGYVGLVVASAPAEVVSLTRDINNQRRELYQQIARQNSISVEQVAALAFEKAVAATPAGQYLQDASGSWVEK